ncbi:MAG: outer membrane protein multidrug efflux system [Pseudomonadota bacterium]|jgi:NodT family efflux transporter outer membrane factor (OMF) lipoprotein|nr:outer membrane protein multidrug efflux system [Pseudomonadota bacterium]HCY38240.1 transporter [Neisseriales bacterium]
MRKISVLSLVVTATMFGGCALFSPSYHQPNVEAPTTTRSGMAIESTNIDLSQMEWWKKVNDPVLNQLIILALSNNAQIQVAQGNIMQAQARLKAAEYSWIPTFSAVGGGFAGGSFLTNTTPQGGLANAIPGGGMSNSNFNGAFAGFVPSYSFNVFANISQTKLAQATLELQKAAYNATRLTVIGQVSGGYFNLLAQKRQLLLQQQLIDDAKELSRLEMIQVKNGAADMTVIAQYDQQIANYQAQIPPILNAISQTENAIQVLINQNPGPIVTNGSIDKLNIESIIPAYLPSSVLRNRPDIIQAEGNLRIANANIAVANSKFFPSVNITGFGGGMTAAFAQLLNLSTGFWTVAALASMPIIDVSSYEQVKAQKGSYYAAYYSYINTVKSAFQNVDDNLTNKQNMDKVYAETYKSYLAADEYYRLTKVQYNYGNSSMTNVLQAKQTLDNVNLSLLQAKASQLSAIVQVYQALAGGYAAESDLSKPKELPN